MKLLAACVLAIFSLIAFIAMALVGVFYLAGIAIRWLVRAAMGSL